MSHTVTQATAEAIGKNALSAMLETETQGECMQALRAALVQLSKLPHKRTAAAAFIETLSAPIVECQTTPSLDDVGEMLSGLMVRQKQIRYARNENTCPSCGADTVFLNVGPDHFEVCHSCKKQLHYGENLHSGWRDEPMEVWHQNAELLKGYSDFDLPDLPPVPAAADGDDLPF